ncbi:MAG: YitT family protein, partial [Chlamydiae bacterium]|nr:YitT family protein [Chlamydiota bacterium]
LMTYVVAMKMIDIVIVGLDEVKSALIISSNPRKLSQAIISELGLGLTIIHGKGGFSGEPRDLLFVVLERLDLSDLKELVLREDPTAFIAIENLHEVVQGTHSYLPYRKKKGARGARSQKK